MNKAYKLALITALGLLAGLSLTQSSAAKLAGGSAPIAMNVTFSKDIAPIFFKSCAECHRPGEAAPFSVLSYKDVRPWAKSIREKVANRTMPPWHADPHVGQWQNDPRLSQAEIDKIAAWVEQGAPEGAAKDLPPVPQFTSGWRIGKPDRVIQMPETFTLEANGPDEYQYFEVDPGFKEDVYISQAEARPDNRRVVHHIIAFVKPPMKDNGAAKLSKAEQEKRKAAAEREDIQYQDGFLRRTKADAPVHNEGCQLPNGGAGGDRQAKQDTGEIVWLAAYAPGTPAFIMPPQTAIRVPAGSTLLFQMHYSKVAGSVQKDRSSIGLIFAKEKPEKEQFVRAVANQYFSIPAGAERHQVTACWTVPENVHIVSFAPHMHVRGKAQRIEAFYPNGQREVLLEVPAYDFNWQESYQPAKPMALPKGTRILTTSWFDNSARNKFNPDPGKAVRWGDPTYDEMMIAFVTYTKDGQNLKNTTALNRE